MARYFFHLYSTDLLRDQVGEELPGIEAAKRVARRSAGELIAEQIASGEPVDLDHRIDIEHDNDGIVFTLEYRNLFFGLDRVRI